MYVLLLGFSHFYLNLESGSLQMEDFGFKSVAAEGAGALFNLVLCVCMCTYMQEEEKEGEWAKALMVQLFWRTGFPEIKEVVGTEMTRQTPCGGYESRFT